MGDIFDSFPRAFYQKGSNLHYLTWLHYNNWSSRPFTAKGVEPFLCNLSELNQKLSSFMLYFCHGWGICLMEYPFGFGVPKLRYRLVTRFPYLWKEKTIRVPFLVRHRLVLGTQSVLWTLQRIRRHTTLENNSPQFQVFFTRAHPFGHHLPLGNIISRHDVHYD